MLRKHSKKDEKMSGKTRLMENHQIMCWICHQDISSLDSRREKPNKLQSNYTRPSPSKIFRPCLCKGSIGSVHQECLNRWALEKYNSIVKKPSKGGEEELPVLSCPNCKTHYEYNLMETKKISGLKARKITSVESICLLLLVIFQIWVFVYQFTLSPPPEEEHLLNGKDGYSQYMTWAEYIHLATVVIVLAAAGFNLLEKACTEVKIEVLSQF